MKEKYILIIKGIDKEKAKELAEDFGGGSMMWFKKEDSIIAYPSEGSSVEIKEENL